MLGIVLLLVSFRSTFLLSSRAVLTPTAKTFCHGVLVVYASVNPEKIRLVLVKAVERTLSFVHCQQTYL